MLELRLVLLLTVREFDIEEAYGNWYRILPYSGLREKKEKLTGRERGIMYQIEKGGAQPGQLDFYAGYSSGYGKN